MYFSVLNLFSFSTDSTYLNFMVFQIFLDFFILSIYDTVFQVSIRNILYLIPVLAGFILFISVLFRGLFPILIKEVSKYKRNKDYIRKTQTSHIFYLSNAHSYSSFIITQQFQFKYVCLQKCILYNDCNSLFSAIMTIPQCQGTYMFLQTFYNQKN